MSMSTTSNGAVPGAASPLAATYRELAGLLRSPRPAPARIAELLDSLGHQQRLAAIRALGRDEQRQLWHAVDSFAPLALTDIVPAATPANQQVRHFGKNTLPLFTTFEKRFLRPLGQDAAAPAELHGYNFQDSAVGTWFAGPGYFVATASPDRPEVLIDYRQLPATRPDSWPPIRSNSCGGGRFVYGFMVDTLRKVSAHVTIGRANRHGKDMDAWFMLCRDASDSNAAS